ncbi:MAG: hypothetical protein AB7L92_02405 [Alphaproteobacteria bacterium]
MTWEKRGFIYGPKHEADWMRSYAQVPTALVLDDRIRVYITVRPEQKTSMVTFVDMDIHDPQKVLYVHKEPILPLGSPGTFDEFGIMPAAVERVGSEVWLYTTGWQRGQTVPYLNAVGLAVSKDGGKTFHKPYPGPVLSITKNEPFSSMSPSIVRRGKNWEMWYGSGVDWIEMNGKYEPLYYIYYAHSDNGIDWQRPGICCIAGSQPGEATTRPGVIFDEGEYRMWFSYRGSHDFRGGAGSYRIGYASSTDGKTWVRDDSKSGIYPSDEGWDSQMIAYPNIVDTHAGRYMFYNGNDFGAHGFGYAKWV